MLYPQFLSPSFEFQNQINERFVKYSLIYQNVPEADKNELFNFIQDITYFPFTFYTFYKYPYFKTNTDIVNILEPNLIILKDYESNKDNLVIGDDFVTYKTLDIFQSNIVDDTQLQLPLMVFVEQDFVSNDTIYLELSSTDFLCQVKQIDNNLVLYVENNNYVYIAHIDTIKVFQVDILGRVFKFIVYGLSIYGNKIVLAHNNQAVEIQIDNYSLPTFLDMVSEVNIYNLIISNFYASKEVIKNLSMPLGNTLSVYFYSDYIKFSKSVNCYAYAKIKHIGYIDLENENIYATKLYNENYDFKIDILAEKE